MTRLTMIATDLDGTLLNSRSEVSPRNRAALARAAAEGLAVVLVTGRPSRMVLPLAGELGLRGYVVCSNGAQTLSLETGEPVDVQALSERLLRTVIPALRAALPGVMFGLEWGHGMAIERGYRDVPGALDDVLNAYERPTPPGPVLKLMTRAPQLHPRELAAQASALSGGRVTGTYSGASFAELHAPQVSKAFALERLAARLGLAARQAVAFGDAPNDLEMLRWAGYSVAMGNALPGVAEHATEVTLSNDEDGVAVVLERLAGQAWHLGVAPA